MVFQKYTPPPGRFVLSVTGNENMTWTSKELGKFLETLGRNLLHDAIHPVLGITLAQWLLDDESGIADCLATGAVALLMILIAGLLSLGCSRIISLINQSK